MNEVADNTDTPEYDEHLAQMADQLIEDREIYDEFG